MTSMPKTVWLILTTDCNNRCVWCYAEEQKIDQMPLSRCYDYIDLCEKIGVQRIILIGGEPTLHPQIMNIIERLSKMKMFIGIVTNGRILADEKFTKKLSEYKVNVTISLEGANEKQHDSTTRIVGSFEQVLMGIKNCQKYKVNYETMTTISEKNKNELRAMVDFINTLGKTHLTFNYCGPTISNPNLDCVLEPKEIAEKVQDIFLYSKEKNVKVKFATSTAKCLIEKDLLYEMIETKSLARSRSCIIFNGDAMSIDHNGDILPCTHWVGLSLGNMIKDNLLDKTNFNNFWIYGKPAQFRKSILKYPSEKCSKCLVWGDCVGGCPLFWLKFKPEEKINEETACWNKCINEKTLERLSSQ